MADTKQEPSSNSNSSFHVEAIIWCLFRVHFFVKLPYIFPGVINR